MAFRKSPLSLVHLRSLRSLLLAPFLLTVAYPLAAQTTVYWDVNGATAGAGGEAPAGEWTSDDPFWNTDASGGAGTLSGWTAGNIAAFSAGSDATGAFSVTIQDVQNIRGLKFEDGAVTLQGGGLNLTGAANFEVAEGLTATLDGVNLSGGFALTKLGLGKLVLTGAPQNTLTGDFKIANGTIELAVTGGGSVTGSGNVLIESPTGTASSLSPATLRLMADEQISDSAMVTVISRQYRAGLFDLNGFNETVGGLTIVGYTGTPDVGVRTGAGGVLTVMGDIFLHNDRGGSTGNNVRDVLITGTGSRGSAAPNSGILDLGGGIRTITVQSRAATLYPNSDATIETTIRNGGIIKEGEQMLILTGTNTYAGGTTISAGTLRIGQGSSTGSIVGDVINNAVLEFYRSNALTFAGDISGTGTVVKMGGSTLTLTGANSYAGLTRVLGGNLEVQQLGMAGVIGGSNVGINPVIELGDDTTAVSLIYSGAGETTDKIIRFTTTTGNPTVTASGAGGVVFQNAFEFTSPGDKTLMLTGTSAAANTIGGGLADPTEGGVLSLLKSGSGTWVLAGDNSYTGLTTVNNGTLRLSGSGDLGSGGLLIQNGTFEVATDAALEPAAGLKLAPAELIDYAVIMGGGPAGSAAAISITPGQTLLLNGNLGYSSTNNNLAASISGGTLDLGSGARYFVINNSSAAEPDLTIGSALVGAADSTMIKSGPGTLQLTGNLNLGSAQVNQGKLVLGGAENVISHSLEVGYNNAGSLFYDIAGGSLSVGSGSADSFGIGLTVNASTYSYAAPTGVVDLRGSDSFTANVGTVRVGVHTAASGNAFAVPADPSLNGLPTPGSMTPNLNALYLPTHSDITASTNFVVGDAASSSVGTGINAHQVQFGEGLNTVRTPLMYIGYRKGSGTATIRDGGTLNLAGVAPGSATHLYIGYNAINTAGATQSRMDLSNGTFIAALNSLTIGWKSSGSGETAGSSIGALILGSSAANQITVSGNVIVGYIAGTQTSSATFGRGTLDFAGGTFTVNGNVELAKMVPSGNGLANPNMTAAGTLNLTGGTFTVGGSITRTEGFGDRNVATVTLDGGTLNMTAGAIGTASAPVIFNARSGTLRALSELNGGGALVKTTEGTLLLAGSNTYTGATMIQAGALEVLAPSSTGSGPVSVTGATAVLAGEGTITGNATLTSGSIRPGANAGADHGMLQFAADLTLAASVGSGAAMVLGITTPTGIADLYTYSIDQIPGLYDFVSYNYETHNIGDHDLINVSGTLTWNEGTRLIVEDDNFNPAYGQVFNLLDWGGLLQGGPSFDSDTSFGGEVNSYLTLPSLTGTGYHWDLSLFTTYGVVVVVPEPSRALLLLLAAVSLFAVRRRRGASAGFGF